MEIKKPLAVIIAAGSIAFFSGCGQSGKSPAQEAFAPWPDSSDTLVRIHWLGKKKLGVEGSAYYFMRIWDMPETKVVESQTLDKLSLLPWRLWRPSATNAPIPLLRPLLNDLLQDESYFEWRQPTNGAAEFVLAVRLPEDRAGVWETNLAVVAQSLTDAWPIKSDDAHYSWSLARTNAPGLELRRIQGWTILSSTAERSLFSKQIADRIEIYRKPFSRSSTNFWIEMDASLDLPGIGPGELSMNVGGDGADAILRGALKLAQPLNLDLKPWDIPVQLMHEPLSSFTAIRGLNPWFESASWWRALQTGSTPGQFFSWSLDTNPLQTYAAIPLHQAGPIIETLSQRMLSFGNAWLNANSVGTFGQVTNGLGIVWSGLPALSPFLTAVHLDSSDFVYGGTMPDLALTSAPPPSEGMIQDVIRRTNLVCYEWEMTGARLQGWLYLGQTARVVARRGEIPLDCPSIAWLGELRPRLGTCASVVTLSDPNTLSFLRKSTTGLNAVELQFLADWLESPAFPFGLRTLFALPN